MNKYTSLILLTIIAISFINCSNKSYLLANRKYLIATEYNVMELYFLNKNECVYTESFTYCDLEPGYQQIKIFCNYKLRNNIISLKNKYPIDSLKNKAFIKIPDKVLHECDFMNKYSIDSHAREYSEYLDEIIAGTRVIAGLPRFYNNAYYAGYLNYIDKEKFYFQDSIIVYSKITFSPTSEGGYVNKAISQNDTFNKGINAIFIEEGRHMEEYDKRRQLIELSKKSKLPSNIYENNVFKKVYFMRLKTELIIPCSP